MTLKKMIFPEFIPNRTLSIITFIFALPLYLMMYAVFGSHSDSQTMFWGYNYLFMWLVSLPLGSILFLVQCFQISTYFYRKDVKSDVIGFIFFYLTLATIVMIYFLPSGFFAPN